MPATRSLSLMDSSSKLFYIVRSQKQIRVIDLSEKSPSKLVIEWKSYNNQLRTLAASGGYVFWTERTYNAVFDQYGWSITGGRLKNGVITTNNTWQINYHRGRRYAIYELVAFEHNFPPTEPPTEKRTFPSSDTTPGSIASLPTPVSWKIILSVLVLAIATSW